MTGLPFLDAAALRSLVPWPQAIDALAAALDAGDHRSSPPRTAVPVAAGELLLMPAESAEFVGVKLLSVASGNPAVGLPRIQAVYVLMDAATLTPSLLIDGAALTTLRTPALSALAVDRLAAADASSLVVFGTGPQAAAHVAAISAVRALKRVTIVARNAAHGAALVRDLGVDAAQGAWGADVRGVDDVMLGVACEVALGAAADVATADIVVCATSAATPLFDGRMLADRACVVAVGSHQPDARELDEQVFARATRVVVEDRETALREAGDVIHAIAAGAIAAEALVELTDLASGYSGLSVFKSVGMGWQDLAVAQAAWRLSR